MTEATETVQPQENARPRGSALNDLLAGMSLAVKTCERPSAKDSIELMNITKNLYAGNTALIDALCGMCEQYLSKTEDGGWMHHDFMSAGEYALTILEQAGLVEDVGGSFRFIKNGIGLRELES